ncbi:MAG: PAS domain-containing protein [Hyphomicrobiaceae bacterium]|nr:PAS domain-containing protein [Hyphomicrobiaceae bacterium]
MNSSDIQRAFRHIPGPFLILKPDRDFTIVAASEDYLHTTHTSEAIFGRPLFEVFPDNPGLADANGVKNLRDSLERVCATRAADIMPVQRYDVQLPQGGFEERYWAPVNSPVLGENGEVEFLIHHVEDASAKANRDAIDVLESITEGFFTLDRQWRFDYVNREAHRILDREPGSLSGQVLWAVYPGLEGTEFERGYHRTMHQREKSSFTAFYPNQGRWYEVTAFPAPEGISVYFRNVTAQKNLEAGQEKLIAESEQQRRIYETALNSTPDFVYVFDRDHRAMYANDALLKTWGTDDVRGKTWMELGYEQWHADMHDRELDQVINSRAPIRGEIPFTGTGGRRIYDYIFAPVFGADGEVVAVAGTTRDITDRQAAEQSIREQASRLAESDRSKDEFLATLSHELRNPLAPLRNSIALLRRASHGEDRAAPIHDMMERQVNHLVRLVDELLELSRISRGTLSLRNERVELATVVRNALETIAPLVQAAGHELAVELPPEPVWLEGDDVRLVQILANLLDNAIKYTESGGSLALRAAVEDGFVAITVSDNGIGIAPDALPRMFEMFSRGDRDSARTQGGLGIGLALSRRLAEMQGGTLNARSEGLGKGSAFTVRLPLAAQAETAEAERARHGANLALTRVLVVDDNHDAGDSLAMILEMLGADVRVARGGVEALETFSSYQPSVVLLDIGMPGMNGYEVARAIRSGYPGNPVVIVALTGWGQEEDRRRSKEAGFDHHLVKPAEIDALQELLSSIEKSTRALK